jgi:hypothetical protein
MIDTQGEARKNEGIITATWPKEIESEHQHILALNTRLWAQFGTVSAMAAETCTHKSIYMFENSHLASMSHIDEERNATGSHLGSLTCK